MSGWTRDAVGTVLQRSLGGGFALSSRMVQWHMALHLTHPSAECAQEKTADGQTLLFATAGRMVATAQTRHPSWPVAT